MSHITVSAAKVADSAQALIDRIMAERNRRDEKCINAMVGKKVFFAKGIFHMGWKPMTREDAIKSLCEEPILSGYPSIYAWGSLERAKKLLTLAKNGDPVIIDADDAQLLWGK